MVGQRDGDEATGRDEDRGPNGPHLADEEQRVAVDAQVVVGVVGINPVSGVVDRRWKCPGDDPTG